MNELVDFIEKVINNCQQASNWFIEFLSTDAGLSYLKYVLKCYTFQNNYQITNV